MIHALIPVVTTIIGKAIDRAVPDKDLAARLKHDITTHAQDMAEAELQGAIRIITAEVTSESWLTRSWRPIIMLWFGALLGLYWFGLAPAYLVEHPEVVEKLFQLLQIGIGGYVIGRSAEKATKAWRGNDK